MYRPIGTGGSHGRMDRSVWNHNSLKVSTISDICLSLPVPTILSAPTSFVLKSKPNYGPETAGSWNDNSQSYNMIWGRSSPYSDFTFLQWTFALLPAEKMLIAMLDRFDLVEQLTNPTTNFHHFVYPDGKFKVQIQRK